MAIWTKEQDVPSGFPPAQLFLDDIEEIVCILQEALQSRKMDSHSTVEDLKMKVRFSAEGKECDEIQDLPKIAKSNRPLQIVVSRGRWSSTQITIHPWLGTRWTHWDLTEAEAWSTFRKLQPLFQKRNRRWSALLHSVPYWLQGALVATILVGVPLLGLVALYKYKLMPQGAAVAEVLLLYGIIIAAIVMGVRRSSYDRRASPLLGAIPPSAVHQGQARSRDRWRSPRNSRYASSDLPPQKVLALAEADCADQASRPEI